MYGNLKVSNEIISIISKILALFLIVVLIKMYLDIFGRENNFRNYKSEKLTFIGKGGKEKTKIIAYVADDFTKKAKGLMFIDLLSYEEGMLFIMGNGTHSFWMKNVKINLEAIGLSKEGEVIDIKTMRTCSNKCPNYKIRGYYILEVKEGFSKKYNIKIGDKVELNQFILSSK